MELKEVLLIEDNPDTASEVSNSLESEGIVLTVAKNDQEMTECFAKNPGIQIVVLDWLLDGKSSVEARLCLQRMRENWFVPVVIWSEEIERFNEESDEVHKTFPASCLSKHSKSQVRASDLLNILSEWNSTPPMSIFGGFRRSAVKAINQSFYDLADQSANDLVKGLKSLFSLDAGKQDIDTEHAIDVFTRMIGRIVYSDEGFNAELSEFLSSLDFSKELSSDEKRMKSAIQDYHMYYLPRAGDRRVRTGDIVEIKLPLDEGEAAHKAIVVTPACDLAVPGKTEFLRLLVIRPVESNRDRSAQDRWLFLEDGNEQVARFHEMLVLRNESYGEAGDSKPVMSYDHKYETIGKIAVGVKRLKRLDDPYRADLIHKFTSHAGRIGVPEFDAR